MRGTAGYNTSSIIPYYGPAVVLKDGWNDGQVSVETHDGKRRMCGWR